MALSLLENDKPKKYEDYEGPTSAELDRESKDYMDSGKIFKQLKSAFNPTSAGNRDDDSDSGMSKTYGGFKNQSSLEPIIEESALMATAQSKIRQKKVEQLLSKVK